MKYIEEKGTTFEIENYPWDENGYKPKTEITIGYDNGGYKIQYISYETDLHAVQTQHNSDDIHKDSCLEIYMQFAPQTDKNYINIEVNPNGAVYSSVSSCREVSKKIDIDDIEKLNVKTKINNNCWEVNYYIPKEYIQKFIPTYKHEKGSIIRGNFYKCGDDAQYPHFGCYSNIVWDFPDFHRPEFFAEFKLV